MIIKINNNIKMIFKVCRYQTQQSDQEYHLSISIIDLKKRKVWLMINTHKIFKVIHIVL